MNINIKLLPGINSIYVDYLNNHLKVENFFDYDFRNINSFNDMSSYIDTNYQRNENIVFILKNQNLNLDCSDKTLENIERLATDNTYAIVTGQQAGLFTGPLYTIYKALTSIKLAERLNEKNIGNFVPIFWIASDDHDFKEIDHIHVINKDNQIETIRYEEDVTVKIPISERKVSTQINAIIQLLESATHDSEFKTNIIKILRESYQPGKSFSEAFGILLTKLLGKYGLIIIDPADGKLKQLGKSVFIKEISDKSPSTDQVLESSKLLGSNNYNSQVNLQHGFLNLFYIEKERYSISFKNDGYIVNALNQKFNIEEFTELANQHPEKFSPNVILRPVFQDELLPTVAYIAGPGEVAYYAQLKKVYPIFGKKMPIIFPRKSISIIEKRIARIIRKHELEITDFWTDTEGLINSIFTNQLPENIRQDINRMLNYISTEFRNIKQNIASIDPTLDKAVENSKGKIDFQINQLEKKIFQAYKRVNDVQRKQIYNAANHIYPNRTLQERQLNIVPFLFKYSFEIIDLLYDALDIENFDHQLISV